MILASFSTVIFSLDSDPEFSAFESSSGIVQKLFLWDWLDDRLLVKIET